MNNYGFIVYFLLDENENILYIGKTSSFIKRMSQHFSKDELTKNNWKSDIKSIKIHYFDNPIDMSIYEIYLINKYNPKYNLQDSYKGYVSHLYLNENVESYTLDINNLHHEHIINIPNENINTNKIIDVYKPTEKFWDIFNESNTHKFINMNVDRIRCVVYNLFKNVYKFKNKESTIHYVYPEHVQSICISGYKRSVDNFSKDSKVLCYIGYINIRNKDKKIELEYNYNQLLKTINRMESDEFTLIILSKELRDYFINNY